MTLDRKTRENLAWADRVHDLWERLDEHRLRMVFHGMPTSAMMRKMRVPAEPPWPDHRPAECDSRDRGRRTRGLGFDAAWMIAEARALAASMMVDGRAASVREVEGYEGYDSVSRACDPPLRVRVRPSADPLLHNDSWILDTAWEVEPAADRPCIASPGEPGGRVRSLWAYGPSFGVCDPTEDSAGPISLDPQP